MTDPLNNPQWPNKDITAALTVLRARWRWFVGIGIALIILGSIALIYTLVATLASVLFIGILMLMGAVAQLVQAWRVKSWSGFLLWSLSGLLYATAGIVAIVNPVVGAALLTLLLGATLIAAGAFRLWVWLNNRGQQGWSWLLFSSLVTLATGILIAIGWPANSVWILGLLLGFDLLFQGWSLLLAGFALRKSV